MTTKQNHIREGGREGGRERERERESARERERDRGGGGREREREREGRFQYRINHFTTTHQISYNIPYNCTMVGFSIE